MRALAPAAIIATAALLAGCAPHWVKAGATPQEFETTRAMCWNQAYQHYPVALQQQQVGPGYYTAPALLCSGWGPYGSCSQVGGQYVPPPVANVDMNAQGRPQAVSECLFKNGWHPE